MDNWGDPWADNAGSSTKSPTKDAVTSPLPTTFAAAPTILGGFLDDAGWGNEDESFGDWSTATVEHVEQTPSPLAELHSTAPTAHSPVDTPWDTIDGENRDAVHEEGDWAAVRLDAHTDEDHVVSESSDAATTVPANDTHPSPTVADPLKDSDSSARTSTSPSEASRNDVLVESPRTSYEEDRGAVKATPTEEEDYAAPHYRTDEPSAAISTVDDQRKEDEAAVLKDTQPVEAGGSLAESTQNATSDSTEDTSALSQDNRATSQALEARPSSSSAARATYPIDPNLLAELFTLPKAEQKLDEPPDDPIYSTASRKAWYRLTRKQTMREFNSGNDDDNYIRVTWTNSEIRSEVNKIVGRWAREDRIAGTGPGARASFYWDTAAPVDPKPMNTPHMRQKSSMHISSVVAPTTQKQELPPVSTNVPAAFSWSSATPSTDPWQQASPGLRSTSSPVNPAATRLQRQEGRAVSLDMTSRQPETAKHVRNLTATNETPIVASLISPPITNANTSAHHTWTGLDLFDNNATQKDVVLAAAAPVVADDEDEWGEMVSTPTVSTPTLTEPTTHVDKRDNALPTSITTPQSIKSASVRDQSPDAMHATPIVRLKSTISPTSALFKANPFVPIGIEQGPIGPGILKSSKRAVSNSRTPEEVPPPKAKPDLGPTTAPYEPPPQGTSDDLSAEQVSASEAIEAKPLPTQATIPVQEAIRPSTPPPPATIAPAGECNLDGWADADFSFFESSTLAPAPQTKQDSSDPFSMFETRERSTSAASSAKTFTRSPPRKVPTPPIQPLTGATSSAQRRKMEEDAIVQGILHGLPDLSYMLR